MEKQPIYAYEFEGIRHDAGDKLGFLKATVEFGLKNKEFGHGVQKLSAKVEAVDHHCSSEHERSVMDSI